MNTLGVCILDSEPCDWMGTCLLGIFSFRISSTRPWEPVLKWNRTEHTKKKFLKITLHCNSILSQITNYSIWQQNNLSQTHIIDLPPFPANTQQPVNINRKICHYTGLWKIAVTLFFFPLFCFARINKLWQEMFEI